MIIFSSFSHLGLFPQVFGQVKEWPKLKLHEKIRALHAFVCPILFILFGYLDWQGIVLKLMKNHHFLVFLAVWVICI